MRSIILLNAGATIDILEQFTVSLVLLPPCLLGSLASLAVSHLHTVHPQSEEDADVFGDLTFYIFDSHRPLNLANVYDQDRVLIFDDGQTAALVPEPRDVLNESDNDEEEEDDDDDDDGGKDDQDPAGAVDGDAAVDGGGSRRRRAAGGLVGEAKAKRRRDGPDSSPGSRRALRRQRDTRQREYYRATYHATSAAVLMWQLAADLGRSSSNEMLWLAIVGLTDQHVHERLDHGVYIGEVARLGDDVRRNNRSALEGRSVLPWVTMTCSRINETIKRPDPRKNAMYG